MKYLIFETIYYILYGSAKFIFQTVGIKEGLQSSDNSRSVGQLYISAGKSARYELILI